ncbi:hypothetical protein ACTWPF_14145 [Oceanobacillus sp. M65]|uniref:hypothetical protein n=1 Tax=Oceanobacillus sp. M65 TaxID=3457435 RepID=UPI003FCDD232
MRVILELLRIIFIFILLGGFTWEVLNSIYSAYEGIETYKWIGAIGIYLTLFVLYRNIFQFSGWYQGKGRKKLPRNMTFVILCASILCILLPFPMEWLGG